MMKGLPLLRRFFSVPHYAGEDEARTANILTTILLVLIGVFGLYTLLSFLDDSGAGRFGNPAVLVYMLLVLVLLRRSHIRAARIMLAVGLWLAALLGGLLYGGFTTSGPTPFMAVVVIHGVILKGRAQVLAFAATLVTVISLFILEAGGFLSPNRPALINFNPMVSSVFLLGFTALVLYFITRNLGDALYRAHSNEEATRALLDDLVDTSISRSYLDNILSSLSDTLIVLGPQRQIERVNPPTLKLLGYTHADLIGQPVDKILSPDALRWLDESQAQAVTSIETTYIASDGHAIPVSFSSAVLYSDDQTSQGIVCVAQDISERQRAAQQLRQREELYRTLARILPGMGVILYDHEGRIMIAEGQTLSDYGYESSAIEGKSVDVIDPIIEGADIGAICRQTLDGEHIEMESHYGDDTLDIEVLPVRNEAGDIFAGLILLHNITETKTIETELMSRIEQLTTLRQVDSELSRTLNSDYVLEIALEPLMHVGKAQSAAVFVYQDTLKLVAAHGDHPAGDLEDEVQQVMREGKAINGGTYAIIPLTSMQRPLGAVVLGSDHKFTEAAFSFVQILAARIAVALDNAQLYEMSVDQLAASRDLYERVSQLEQLKTDMIRIAAHDLRNPLNIVSGFTELLLDSDELPDNEREQLQHIFRAAGRMQTLVADILSLDRIERLQDGGYENSVDLTELLRSIYQAHEVKAQDHVYTLVLPDQPVEVLGDEPQLREAISNLIGNALKYTPAGGEVTVSLKGIDNQAIFEVIDTGYGITKEAQERLFEPFYRVKDKETRLIEGTGLGLHLVKNIIERHNGSMFVESVHGEGSTFGFRLNLAAPSKDTNDQTELAMP